MNKYEDNFMFADGGITYNASIEYLITNILHPVLLSINDQLISLQNFKTAQNYSTTKSDFIQPFVLKNETRIFIKSIDGEMFALVVKNEDFIKNIKMEICNKIGMIAEEHILCFQGTLLDDMMTLNDYEIINDSIINIFARLRGGMQIFAKTLDLKTVTFEVKGSSKIIEVKYKIQEKLGLHPEEQRLVFAGAVLEDEKTLDDYQVSDKSIINVVSRLRGGMQLFAKTMDGKTVAFEVHRTERIIDIKKKIQEKIGLQPDEQKLVYQGAMLDDDKTIDDLQIAEKSVINVVARLRGGMQIFAKTMDGKTVAFEVHRTERIIDIKKKIQEKLGLHPDEQKLVFQGGILDDDKTIDEYQICEKSVINVVARLRGGMQLFAKTMDGKTITFEVEKSDKIIDIKKKIKEKISLPLDGQKLIYQGMILEGDDKTIDECQITDKGVINIVATLRGGFKESINSSEEQTIFFDIENIKKLLEKTRLPRDDQDKLLDDEYRIDEYGIREISMIDIFILLKNEFQIFIRSQSRIPINIVKSRKNIDSKSIFQQKAEMQFDENILVYKINNLLNENLLNELKIEDDSELSIDNGIMTCWTDIDGNVECNSRKINISELNN